MKVYAVASSKGGTGKSTTAAELAAAEAARGRRVLVIDLDQQGNVSARLGVTPDTEVGFTADVLRGEASIAESATPAPSLPGAFVIAGSQELAALDLQPSVVLTLSRLLPASAGEWDSIVLDTAPALSPLTLSGLAAADVIVVPLECKTEAYDQLARLVPTINQVQPGETFRWILPTKYDGRRRLDREVLEILQEQYPGRVTSPVRETIAAADSYTLGLPVSVYVPNAPIATDYAAAIATILDN